MKCDKSQQDRILRSFICFLTAQGRDIPEAPLLPSRVKFHFDTILTGHGESPDGNREYRLLCKMQLLMEG